MANKVVRVEVDLTPYAIGRCQLRGVSIAAAVIAAIYGQPTRVSRGRVQRMLTHRAVEEFRKQRPEVPVSQWDRLAGVTVITEDRGPRRVLVTILPTRRDCGPRQVRRRQQAYIRHKSGRGRNRRLRSQCKELGLATSLEANARHGGPRW